MGRKLSLNFTKPLEPEDPELPSNIQHLVRRVPLVLQEVRAALHAEVLRACREECEEGLGGL